MGCGLSARLCAEAGEARGALEGWDSCVPRGRRVFLAVRNAASHGRAHGHNHGRATPFPGRCPRPSQDAAHGHHGITRLPQVLQKAFCPQDDGEASPGRLGAPDGRGC